MDLLDYKFAVRGAQAKAFESLIRDRPAAQVEQLHRLFDEFPQPYRTRGILGGEIGPPQTLDPGAVEGQMRRVITRLYNVLHLSGSWMLRPMKNLRFHQVREVLLILAKQPVDYLVWLEASGAKLSLPQMRALLVGVTQKWWFHQFRLQTNWFYQKMEGWRPTGLINFFLKHGDRQVGGRSLEAAITDFYGLSPFRRLFVPYSPEGELALALSQHKTHPNLVRAFRSTITDLERDLERGKKLHERFQGTRRFYWTVGNMIIAHRLHKKKVTLEMVQKATTRWKDLGEELKSGSKHPQFTQRYLVQAATAPIRVAETVILRMIAWTPILLTMAGGYYYATGPHDVQTFEPPSAISEVELTELREQPWLLPARIEKLMELLHDDRISEEDRAKFLREMDQLEREFPEAFMFED